MSEFTDFRDDPIEREYLVQELRRLDLCPELIDANPGRILECLIYYRKERDRVEQQLWDLQQDFEAYKIFQAQRIELTKQGKIKT